MFKGLTRSNAGVALRDDLRFFGVRLRLATGIPLPSQFRIALLPSPIRGGGGKRIHPLEARRKPK